jgi:hypothetical protein
MIRRLEGAFVPFDANIRVWFCKTAVEENGIAILKGGSTHNLLHTIFYRIGSIVTTQ